MSKNRPLSEWINELNQKIARDSEKRDQLLKRQAEASRKARTQRLIQYGAIAESCFGFKDLNLEPDAYQKALYNIANFLKDNHVYCDPLSGKIIPLDDNSIFLSSDG